MCCTPTPVVIISAVQQHQCSIRARYWAQDTRRPIKATHIYTATHIYGVCTARQRAQVRARTRPVPRAAWDNQHIYVLVVLYMWCLGLFPCYDVAQYPVLLLH